MTTQLSSLELSLAGPTRSRSNTKLSEDATSLTSFNPFAEEDENDLSSYTLVTSLLSRMKNTLSAPLSSVATPSSSTSGYDATASPYPNEPRRPSYSLQTQSSFSSAKTTSATDRPNSLTTVHATPAPPLVSLTPAQSEVPTYNLDYERPSSRGGLFSPSYDSPEGGIFGAAIPGFPIADDARSIKTTGSLQRSGSVSKVIRRIRGEGLSKDYWMDDENCKECYDCKSVFTTWRRKHHCRICGQIFCSRCASNVIKGSRFGHDGTVRVCNLCLAKLAKVEDDDDDDRRSIVSSVISFPAHQMGVDSRNISHHPQSPFAASQLFGRTDEPFNLYSIAETKRPMSGSDDSGFGSRPITPYMEREGSSYEPQNPPPFRRALDDDEESVEMSEPFDESEMLSRIDKKAPIIFPGAIPIDPQDRTSSVQFPVGSPEHTLDSPLPGNKLRSRFNSYADFESPTPFIRSRVQSRLDSMPSGEPGWRTRRESTAYAQELNFTSMQHLRVMLRQMLTSEEIPNVKEWEDILLKLALRIARDLTFTALPHRQGEDMDVRRYVKIKKIPGGAPSDSEYVDGAVITKNVALKDMSRCQKNPRVMLVTFPLEFSRVEGQYLHFGQILRQEKEYLGNLAARIAALRPHVVLVEKSVSRIALEALGRHNVSIARNVKSSAIQLISRMTQADVFSSIDKLALEPRLGHCAKFRIQTFDHPLIPGRRKTYMRFEGCSRDMGCTIILRGANITTLRRIKKVTRFLTFVVRNLKLETHLWKDSVITLPAFNVEAAPSLPFIRGNLVNAALGSLSVFPDSPSTPGLSTPTPADISAHHPHPFTTLSSSGIEDDLPDDDASRVKLSRRIDDAIEPYMTTFISVSATLRFPPPYPICHMKMLDVELMTAKRAWEDEVVVREERATSHHQQESTITATKPSLNIAEIDHTDDLRAQIEALPTVNLPVTPSDLCLLSPAKYDEGGNYFLSPSSVLSPSSQFVSSSAFASPLLEDTPGIRTEADIAVESKYSLAKWKHEEFRPIWEWYLRKNKDDFVAEKYQCLTLLEYTIPIADFGVHRACFAPRITYTTFYGENDCTLGQYIEKVVNTTLVQFLDPKAICTGKSCDQPLARHCMVFVHNQTRLFVAVEQWDGIIGRNYHPAPDLITTWSACRVCGSATPFIPVSEEMQRYSFAKFLELHFYPADVKLVQGAGCHHNIYQHHIRYFAYKGMTVRFQADPVILHELVFPPFRIRVRPETQLELKNNDFHRLHRRNLLWYTGLIDELKLISIDAATGDEKSDAKLLADINMLIARAEAEREEIENLINRVYKESNPLDTLALNQVRAFRQDKIVEWQQDFDRLPKPRQPDPRSAKRTSTFGSVRAMWPRRYELSNGFDLPNLPSSSVSEAEEGPLKMRRVTGDSFASSASENSETEMSSELKDKTSSSASVQDDVASRIEEKVQSDPDSDSTIGASRDGAEDDIQDNTKESNPKPSDGEPPARLSRLPRRSLQQPSVAELVKRYQDYLPPQGMQDLANTAFAPRFPVSESDQEYTTPVRLARNKSRHRALPKHSSSISDFEQGYAANIAPRYLTHARRANVNTPGSRIPAPVPSFLESRNSSRRPSPEKRPVLSGSNLCTSSPGGRIVTPTPASGSTGRSKLTTARPPKDKTPARPPSLVGNRSMLRRSAVGKVSNIAKHFERIGRDAERSRSRYNIIRGRRARPVASARAKVEILESVKDVIKDEYEDVSDSSSEADDEEDEEDERQPSLPPENDGQKKRSRSNSLTVEVPATVEELLVKTAPPTGTTFPELELPPNDSTLEGPKESGRNPPPGTISLPPSPFLTSMKMEQSISATTPPQSELDMGAGTERHSILKAISGFWLQPPPALRSNEGDDPMIDPEHIFRDSSMVVRTDEPTSIIALALNSPQYREMLSKSRAEKRTVREARVATDGGEAFMPDDHSVAESASTWGVVNVEGSDVADPTEDLRMPSSKLPWAITFESGELTISCTVLYPEQFDALRRTYDCEKSIIESLARCVKWDASGGKSGSAFLKTRDDRFIAKELSRMELQTMETFAPAYFDYMSSAVSANRPTLLAKVFGCFKISFRKTGTSDKGPSRFRSTQMNLLVMENLFYDRRFSKIYDLKGSTRNRHVQSTGRENEVLLDENLVQTAHLTPFYLREHSKRILRGALFNDSKFLADINVMDYSLVCGVDSQNNELVVGIVDYIRTYTWDKKLESWVKESAFLGGAARGEPTIVTPKQYRQRFISAMERYFPLIPDRWMKQKDTPEEDSNSLVELWPDW